MTVRRIREAWSGKHMFGLSLFRPSRQSNISMSGEERFRYPLPWYLIIRGSIDQKHARTNESGRQISEIHSAFACSRWPLWPYGAYVKREGGNICSVSVFFVRVGSQISPCRAKKDSDIPSPGRTRWVECPTQCHQRQSNPHPMPCPPPPARRLYIDRRISFSLLKNIYCGKILQLSADHHVR